jgi:tetratricopeptide (TPR) repeat protein
MSSRLISSIAALIARFGSPHVESTDAPHVEKGRTQASPHGVMRRRPGPMSRVRSRLCALSFVLASVMTIPAAKAQTAQDTDAEARGLFLAGQAAFATSRYDDALRYFRQSYELSGRPQLLYNIAVAADRLRRDDEALAAFEQFLRDAPADAPQRRDVEARIPVLREAVARAREAVATDTPEATVPNERTEASDETATDDSSDGGVLTNPPPASDRHRSVAPWVLTGAGAAVAVGGVLSFALGRRDAARVTDASDGASWSSVEGAASRARPEMNIGLALMGIGVAGAAIGITWAIVGKHDDEQSATAELSVVPGGLVVSGGF